MFSKAEGFKNDETQQQRSYAQEQGVNPSTQQNAGFEPTPHGSPHPTQNSGCQQVTHVVEQGASPHQATADPFQTRPEPLSPDMQAAAVALAFGQGSQVAVGQHAEGAARTAGPSQPVGSMATSNATTAQAAHEKASIEYVIEPFNYQGVSQSAAAPQPHAQTPQQGQPPLFGAPPPAYYPTAPYGYAPTGHAPMPYQVRKPGMVWQTPVMLALPVCSHVDAASNTSE